MDYVVVDSSGTDDDDLVEQHNWVIVGGRATGSARSLVPLATHQNMQSDIEFKIHNLEQLAYVSVLRAFKAQSDALTWEKEGLITELRKELRVSDSEHRKLLTEVNADDLIREIREWREACGAQSANRNVPQHLMDQLPSPTMSASRKKHRTSQTGNTFGMPSQAMHPQTMVAPTQPLPSSSKWTPNPGMTCRMPNAYQLTHPGSSAAPVMNDAKSTRDPLIGRRVMIRWPEDNTFYEAVITEYNPSDGRHALVYDSNSSNATLEWVNLKQIHPKDIRWVGQNPVPISQDTEAGAILTGRGRSSSEGQLVNKIQPSQNGAIKEGLEDIEILHTETLIKKVQQVLDSNHPDLVEIERAKKILKDHEQSLLNVIAKLADADGEHPSASGNLTVGQGFSSNHGPSLEHDNGGGSGRFAVAKG